MYTIIHKYMSVEPIQRCKNGVVAELSKTIQCLHQMQNKKHCTPHCMWRKLASTTNELSEVLSDQVSQATSGKHSGALLELLDDLHTSALAWDELLTVNCQSLLRMDPPGGGNMKTVHCEFIQAMLASACRYKNMLKKRMDDHTSGCR